MPNPVIYVDYSEIHQGQFDALMEAMDELARFIEANEPRLHAYQVYLNDSRSRMTVLHIHPDAESLDIHLRVAGPRFPKFADFVKLLKIDLYGEASEYAVEQLRQKAEALGGGTVAVHSLQAGFARF